MKRMLIDISNIIPGKGGAGGGVWTYAQNLLRQLDMHAIPEDMEIICIKNRLNHDLQLNNIRTYDHPIPQNSFLGRILAVQFYLPFFCWRKNIQLVHKVAPELPLFLPCPSVITLHDFIFQYYLDRKESTGLFSYLKKMKYRMVGLAAKHALHRADTIIVPSHAVMSEVRSLFPALEKQVVVTHEAATALDVPPVTRSGPSDCLRIIVVAGYFPHKGYMAVIQLACFMLTAGFSRFKITFRGSNPSSEYALEIKRKLNEAGLSTHIEIAPYRVKHDLHDIYADQDCFLLLSEIEGFGLPLLEAQSFGLPVICSDIPVFHELLGDSAIYVDPRQPALAFSEIKKLLEQEGVYETYVLKGHRNVERFSWRDMAEKTFSVYRNSLQLDKVNN